MAIITGVLTKCAVKIFVIRLSLHKDHEGGAVSCFPLKMDWPERFLINKKVMSVKIR